ncbi:hypothetical protein XFF6991_150506 [Xanthomonas phaseoli pv. phaseoli]|uniref:Uncharacterized protein n=1 Tax=Xanthomonas campestris pv. phaseoli TaxID=317013 RepID=A0A7Z7IW98_XANCH|nr:hypothetical protein XFF6991_150506 [Xanthomonas phaseoli pv. phaseoli]
MPRCAATRGAWPVAPHRHTRDAQWPLASSALRMTLAAQHWLRAIGIEVAQNAMTHITLDNAVICYAPLAGLAMHITQRGHHHVPLSERS